MNNTNNENTITNTTEQTVQPESLPIQNQNVSEQVVQPEPLPIQSQNISEQVVQPEPLPIQSQNISEQVVQPEPLPIQSQNISEQVVQSNNQNISEATAQVSQQNSVVDISQQMQNIPNVGQNVENFMSNTQAANEIKNETAKKGNSDLIFIFILFGVILVSIIFLFPVILKVLG